MGAERILSVAAAGLGSLCFRGPWSAGPPCAHPAFLRCDLHCPAPRQTLMTYSPCLGESRGVFLPTSASPRLQGFHSTEG